MWPHFNIVYVDLEAIFSETMVLNHVHFQDYKPEWDPCKVAAPRSGRPTPLPQDKTGNWMVRTTYKKIFN